MSNLSDIGFPTPDEQAVNEMIMHVLEVAAGEKNSHGFYLVYSDPSGAEIYLQGNFNQELVGFNPHFSGKSRRTVALSKLLERESSELDGGFYAWANPRGEGAEAGDYAFVFDVPDFRIAAADALPRNAEIQLTAFASNDFAVYKDNDEYQAAQESEYEHPSKMFSAVGLMAFDESDGSLDLNAVRPIGKFVGEIREAELRTNQLSGEKFYAMLVETLGGEVDVVVDPKYVPEMPAAGQIVSGHFWLSGRIIG